MSRRGPPLESTRNKFGRTRGDETSGSGARTDFAAIESDLEATRKQLSRLPTRRKLAGTVLGIVFATMMLVTLRLLFFLRKWINLTTWCLRRGAARGGLRTFAPDFCVR
jgi:hypothetical protein